MQANGSVTAHKRDAEHHLKRAEECLSQGYTDLATFSLGKAWGNLEWVKLQKTDPLQARLDNLFVKLGLR